MYPYEKEQAAREVSEAIGFPIKIGLDKFDKWAERTANSLQAEGKSVNNPHRKHFQKNSQNRYVKR
jgi:hypothetical protein